MYVVYANYEAITVDYWNGGAMNLDCKNYEVINLDREKLDRAMNLNSENCRAVDLDFEKD